jgi:hypothetical protein
MDLGSGMGNIECVSVSSPVTTRAVSLTDCYVWTFTALFQTIVDKLIPGIPENLTTLHVGVSESVLGANVNSEGRERFGVSALEDVITADISIESLFVIYPIPVTSPLYGIPIAHITSQNSNSLLIRTQLLI